MSPLTLFGAMAVGAMLVFYALEQRSHLFVLCFSLACVCSSAYGFLQGAWPFGIVEAVWSVVAFLRWRSRVRPGGDVERRDPLPIACDMSAFSAEERLEYHALRARVSTGIGERVATRLGFQALIADTRSPREIVDWLAFERRCCPFLDLGLEFRRDRSVWIRVDGPSEAPDFVTAEFAEFRDPKAPPLVRG